MPTELTCSDDGVAVLRTTLSRSVAGVNQEGLLLKGKRPNTSGKMPVLFLGKSPIEITGTVLMWPGLKPGPAEVWVCTGAGLMQGTT